MMKIETICENLKNTIAADQLLVAQYREVIANQNSRVVVNIFCAELIQDTVNKLTQVLQDLEQCLPKTVQENDNEQTVVE